MTAQPGTAVSLVHGKVFRLTKLDGCGMPVAGASSYVGKGAATIKVTENWDNGTEIKDPRMDGTIGVYVPGIPTLMSLTVDVELMKIDAGVIPMCTGDAMVVDYQGTPIGWGQSTLQGSFGFNWALEVWVGVSNAACSGGAVPYGYFLLPAVGYSKFSFDDIGNKSIHGHLQGTTIDNSWGKGPYNVLEADSTPTPGRLISPVPQNQHRLYTRTLIAPPSENSTPGPTTLTLPTPY